MANVLSMTEIEVMVTNITSLYYEAKQYPTVMEEGMTWYSEAHEFCAQTAKEYGLTIEAVAGVVAALSPGSRWDRNKLDAISCIRAAKAELGVDGFKSATYGKLNKDKAYRIASGEHPAEVLGGLKVRAFYFLIAEPNNAYEVCVDGHAIHIALGITDEAIGKVPSMTPRLYEKLAVAYRQAAEGINCSSMFGGKVTPAQVQAVTWVIQRIKKGVVRPEV